MIKIFTSDNAAEVEEMANKWLKENKKKKVVQMCLSSDVVFNPGMGGEPIIRKVRLALLLE